MFKMSYMSTTTKKRNKVMSDVYRKQQCYDNVIFITNMIYA